MSIFENFSGMASPPGFIAYLLISLALVFKLISSPNSPDNRVGLISARSGRIYGSNICRLKITYLVMWVCYLFCFIRIKPASNTTNKQLAKDNNRAKGSLGSEYCMKVIL